MPLIGWRPGMTPNAKAPGLLCQNPAPSPKSSRIDIFPVDPFKGVTGVDDEAGLGGDPGVVVGRVVRHQEQQVGLLQGALVQRRREQVEMGVMPHPGAPGDVGVVIGDLGPLLLEQVHDFQGRGFPVVIHVFFIRDPQYQDFGAVQGPVVVTQGLNHPLHHEIRHRGVDIAGQFDKPGGKIIFPGLPGQVKGIDGNAMAPQAWTGIEGLEPERLGLGGLDDLKDIHPHPQAQHLQFIDQGDVHRPVDVLQQLAHFRRLGGRHLDHTVDHLGVECHPVRQAGGRHAAHHLGDGVHLEGGVARVFPFGREDQIEILPHPVLLAQDGQEQFRGGAGVRGGFQGDQLAGSQAGGNLAGGVRHEAQVRLPLRSQGGGHADDQDIRFAQTAQVVGGGKLPGALPGREQTRQPGGRNVLDIGLPPVQAVHLAGIRVKAQDPKSHLAEAQHQRQPDVAQTDNAHDGLFRLDFFQQIHAVSSSPRSLSARQRK